MEGKIENQLRNGMHCRLCGGETTFILFKQKVLNKYDVQYLECNQCHSLQTEHPYWLKEAYEINLSTLDTGAAQRTLHNLSICFFIAKIFNIHNAIDFGGGDGLLCRLLRDYGINCYVVDKYALTVYAQGFTQPNFIKPDLITGFEVWEHLIQPGEELEQFFEPKPKILIISTQIYSRQGHGWWYISPETGQHIFFYSKEAIKQVSDKYGYKTVIRSGYAVFIRQDLVSIVKVILVNIIFLSKIRHVLRAILCFIPARYVLIDHLNQKKKLIKKE